MDTNLIERRLNQNVSKEIHDEVDTIISNLKAKYGDFYGAHTSVDILNNITCGIDSQAKKYATLSLGSDENSLSHLLKKILLKAYSEKMLKHKINQLIEKLDVLG